MKSLLLALVFSLTTFAAVNPVKDAKASKWILAKGLETPESVYHDPETKMTFVSNVIGAPNAKDGKGNVSVLTVTKGKPALTVLVKGLNAPKGLRAHNGTLWVSDLDRVVAIDIKKKKIAKTIPVPGAIFLNDTAIGADGTVYVSDTIGSKIYAVKGDQVSIFAEGDQLECPNGLLVDGGKLYVAAWGKIKDPATFAVDVPGGLYAIDTDMKTVTKVTTAPLGNLDGLEKTADGAFLVSDWVLGKVFRVTADGKSTVVAEGLTNAADIGLEGTTLLVPDMGANKLYALELKTLLPLN